MAGLIGRQRVFNNINRRVYERMMELMHDVAMETLRKAYELRGFHDVTRNLLNSIAVGGYYKGKLVFMVGAEDMGIAQPLRKSLGYKQKFKVVKGWFVADFPGASGGQSGRSLAKWTLQRTHPAKRATYNLVIIAPMEYAEWVEKKKGHDVLSNVRDAMPGIVSEMVYYNAF